MGTSRWCIALELPNPAAGRLHDHWPWQYPRYFVESDKSRAGLWTDNPRQSTTFATPEEAQARLKSLGLEKFRPLSDFGEAVVIHSVEDELRRFEKESARRFCVKLNLAPFAAAGGPHPCGRKTEEYPYYYVKNGQEEWGSPHWAPAWTRDLGRATVYEKRPAAEEVCHALRNSDNHFNCFDEFLSIVEFGEEQAAQSTTPVEAAH